MTLPNEMTRIEITQPGGPEVLQPKRVPLPVAAEGEVLIRVHAAGINRPDALQRAGKYPMKPGMNPIPGLEVAGEVVALGAGVNQFALGDRVCALTNGGGYAEYCCVPAGQTLPIPDGLDWVQAAAIPETFFTVWANLFGLGGASRGQRALIHGGTSGIGTTAQTKNAFYQMPRSARDIFDHRPYATITKCCNGSIHLQHDLADMIAGLHVRMGLCRLFKCINLVDDRQAATGTQHRPNVLAQLIGNG